MTTVAPAPAVPHARAAGALRRLYLSRSGFAIAWAALLVLSTRRPDGDGRVGPLTAVLLVLYPLVDLAAAVVDRRSTRAERPSALLVVNMALSLLTVLGLVVAVRSGPGAVLLVWGSWAITAGLVQLAVAVRRRALGGQWAMILSGGISVLAGSAFVAQAGGTPSVTGLAGYAVLGGAFFLVSALRLRRAPRGATA